MLGKSIIDKVFQRRIRRLQRAYADDPQRLALIEAAYSTLDRANAKRRLRTLRQEATHGPNELYAPILQRDYDSIREIISEGVWLNEGFQRSPGETTTTPLLDAIMHGDVVSLAILLDNGANPDLSDWLYRKPILDAAEFGKRFALKLLLEYGAEPSSVQDGRGQTPLHYAAMRGDLYMARTLLAHGADLNIKNRGVAGREGNTPAREARERRQRDFGMILESIEDNPDVAQTWLLAEDNVGLPLDTRSKGEAYFVGLTQRRAEPLLLYFFDSQDRAYQALEAISFIGRTVDTGTLVATLPVQYGVFPAVDTNDRDTWAGLVAGLALGKEHYAEVEASFDAHGGRARTVEEPKLSLPREPAGSPHLSAITYEGTEQTELAGIPAKLEHFVAPNGPTALEYLKSRPIDKRSYFVCVETPLGVFTRDVEGIVFEH